MIKTKIISCCLLVSFLSLLVPSELALAYAASPIPLTAPSVILLDTSTRNVVFAKTPFMRRPPASTAKLLTAMVAMNQLRLDQVITIPAFVESVPPSKAYLRVGERYRVRDLLRATLISSANDAAEVLAAAAGGSRVRFASLMNQKAHRLGCHRSHFVNPTGLPAKGQFTTAYDMTLIMREIERYPFLVEALKTRLATIQSLEGRSIGLRNHNKMLWRHHSEIVGKTGWTKTARHCFVGQIDIAGKKLFISMLGSLRLWRDLKTLIDYHFGLSFFRNGRHEKLLARQPKKKNLRSRK